MQQSSDAIIERLRELLESPRGAQITKYVLKALAPILPGFGLVDLASQFADEEVRRQIDGLQLQLAELNEAKLTRILEQLDSTVPKVTVERLTLLLHNALGHEGVALQSNDVKRLPVMLNPLTVEELSPFVEMGWITLEPTHSHASMGSGNRVGNHIEEKLRPWGMGTGFLLTVVVDLYDENS